MISHLSLSTLCVILLISAISCWSPIKPLAARSGATVNMISPASYLGAHASNFTEYQIEVRTVMKSINNYQVIFGAHAFDQWGGFAGTDANRASDVMNAFNNSNNNLIIANRGGWGCDRILGLLDFSQIYNNPKILMGYSDLTALINAVYFITGMVTFHGPMGVDDYSDGYNIANIKKQLSDPTLYPMVLSNTPEYNYTTITSGKVQGKLIGGNLAVFASLVGSNYLPKEFSKDDNYILFLEEVGEAPYRIDRMLEQLVLSKILTNVVGVVFGQCPGCTNTGPGFSWEAIVQEKFQPLNIPAFMGGMFGHEMNHQYILPIGTQVLLDADAGSITLLEAPIR